MKDLLILANKSSEELEVLTVLDFARRAGLIVDLCSVTDEGFFVSSHEVKILCDINLSDVNANDYRAIYLPGGLPGAEFNASDSRVIELVQKFYHEDKFIFSICAGPLVLCSSGISSKLRGTCYPGFENKVSYKEFSKELFVEDGRVVTSRGPATTGLLALKVISVLKSKEEAKKIADQTLWTDLSLNIDIFNSIFRD